MSNRPLPAPPGERFNFAQHLIERNAGHPDRVAYIDAVDRVRRGAAQDG